MFLSVKWERTIICLNKLVGGWNENVDALSATSGMMLSS